MKIPYMKISQRGETFFVTKLDAGFLKEHVDFHFRDPYLKFQSEDTILKFEDYMKKLEKANLNVKNIDTGIQRRLDLKRINDIEKYIKSNSSNFFPNSILVSVDVTNFDQFEEQFLKYEQQETGEFEFPDDVTFTIVDGQHRLAGLFLCDEETINDFEFVVVLLINISLSTAAKLFSDINGKQKAVNRSLLYDIAEQINSNDLEDIKKIHIIAQKLYVDRESPLFRQIKMLGIGKGAISQAFFIDYVLESVRKANLSNEPLQEIYDQLLFYFRAFQIVFPDDWPVPLNVGNYDELDNYANYVLKERNSQLVKTNGFGAILKLFPYVYEKSNGTASSYIKIIEMLDNKIIWSQTTDKPIGTGKSFQTYLFEKMRDILNKQIG